MVRSIVRFPHPGLKAPCQPASPAEARRVAVDLVDTMRAHPRCVGLAAPQIGERVRVAVVDVAGHPQTTACNGLVVLVNAVLIETAGSQVGREGCLSLPQVTADVRRARRIRLRSSPLSLAPSCELWSAGFEARAIQHELDHLDGVLILDRVTSVRALHPRLLPAHGRSVRAGP